MEWSRVKSIMIGIFFVVNVVLFISYFSNTKTSFSIDDETLESTAIILKKHNIVIDAHIIPKTYQDTRTFELKKIYETPKKAADAFWEKAKTQDWDYFSPQRTRVTERTFEYIADVDTSKTFDLKNASKLAGKIVSALGLDDKMNIESKIEHFENHVKITYNQIYEGTKVLDTALIFEFNQHGLYRIFGDNWLCDYVLSGGISPTKPITEILVDFAVNSQFQSIQQVTSIEFGYFVGDRQNKVSISLIPVWKLCTQNEEYFFDARNGDLL